MGQNIPTVIVGNPDDIGGGGSSGQNLSVAVGTSTTLSDDNLVVAAPGAGNRLVVVGFVATTSAECEVVIHFETASGSPTEIVCQFDGITGGGVAYNFAPNFINGPTNEGLYFDHDATTVITVTAYYYTEAV